MATYDAELIAPPPTFEATKDSRDAEVMNTPRDAEVMNTPTASTPRISVDSRSGIARRSVR